MNIRCPVCSSKLIKKYEECSSVYEEYIYECPDCKLFLENTVCGNTYIEIGPFTVQYNYNTEPKKKQYFCKNKEESGRSPLGLSCIPRSFSVCMSVFKYWSIFISLYSPHCFELTR